VELEKKFQVGDHAPYIQAAAAHGFERVSEKHQIDTYFILNQRREDGTRHYLRIREDGIKRRLSLDYHRVLSELETDEIEQPIQDEAAFRRILGFLGYAPLCTVDKRRVVHRRGPVEVTFDQVAGLGSFIEVEIEGSGDEPTIAILEQAVADLGLQGAPAITLKGYPDLLLEQRRDART